MPSFTSFTVRLASLTLAALTSTLSTSAAPLPRPTGFWHTSGSLILDSQNRPVRIAGLNWSGLETTHAVPGGLQQRDYRDLLRSVAAAGYNTIRLPFSNQMVEAPIHPENLRFHGPHGPINQDLAGLNSLEIVDRIVAAAGEAGLRVILDNHRSEAGSSAEENGLWYTDSFPEQRWLADWTALAARYRDNPTVVGFDLRNEPHSTPSGGGACWGCGGPRDWRLAAERAGNAVHRVNPNLLLFVEGTDSFNGVSTWWGGNLAGVRSAPVRLTLPHHLVYSPHVYGPAEFQQPWFNSFTTPASLTARWQLTWAFLADENIAPIFLGEFGVTDDVATLGAPANGSQAQWFRTLTGYLAAHPAIGWAYWSLNGEDRYALLDAGYTFAAANRVRLAALSSLLPPASPAPLRAATPLTPPVTPVPTTPVPTTPVPTTRSLLPAAPVHTAATRRPHPLPAATSPMEEAASSVRLATARALLQLEGQ